MRGASGWNLRSPWNLQTLEYRNPKPKKQKMFEQSTFDAITTSLDKAARLVWETAYGMIGVAIGYFLPIKDMINFIVILFIFDVLFGYLKARAMSGPAFGTPKVTFSTAIVWKTTMPRLGLSLLLLMLTFQWDTVFNQQVLSTYNTVGWFISGMLIISIGKNGFKITQWKVFNSITELLVGRIKDQTGLDLEEIKEQEKTSAPPATITTTTTTTTTPEIK